MPNILISTLFAVSLLVTPPTILAATNQGEAGSGTSDKREGGKAPSDKIATVQIKGNRRIEAAAILQAVLVKAGDTLDLDKVDADLRAIYKLGYFRDVQVQIEKGTAGIVLDYQVQEQPVVREVKIVGAKEISAEKVREALDIKPNSIYSLKELQKGLKKVKKLYSDEGYYLAEVTGNSSRRSEAEVNVNISVKEGNKVLIRSITFQGNKAFSDKKIKKAMETTEKWMFSWLTGAGTYKEEVLKNDAALIVELYMNNGFVNVKVGEPKVVLLPDKSGLIVSVGITEGEQYHLGALSFKGELLESSEILTKKLKEKSGELFSRSNLRSDVFMLTDLYADQGFAFANATPLTKMNPANRTVDITFEMETGVKVHIDRVNISGNAKSRDKVVRRELRLDEGDLYSSTALKQSKKNLMNTGFFEDANLVTVKGSAADKLDLNVVVKEKPTGTFSIGAGYSSLDGIVGQGSVSQANFLGLGLKMTASVSMGARSKTYNLGLTDPYFLDSKWTMGGDLYRSERQYIDYTRRATGFDLKGGYPLNDTVRTFLLYKLEEKEIYNESQGFLEEIQAGAILAPVPTSVTSAIIATISSNTTDYHPDPTSGLLDSLSVEFAGVGGSNHYLKYTTDHTLFHPVAWGTVASLHTSLGYMQPIGVPIPIDELFYLGGIGSLRGYPVRTVSPYLSTVMTPTDYLGVGSSNVNHIFLGGQAEAVANLEYTFPIMKDLGLKGVIFFDAGNSADTIKNTFSGILTSYGAGLRWLSPMGPLRIEYGIPLEPRPGIDSPSGRLEFSMGSIF